ncbi:hypothetical protein EU524_00430 [Candidatus Thorarchaeota archaeon]|nr:MAG: hypothetical protein EU524_00430 [Candidatus Thorarchaeota archaeon]
MRLRTRHLVKAEIRMLRNQFVQALTTPSMMLFYGITFFGVFFVSWVLSSLVTFAPLFEQAGPMIADFIDRGMLVTAFGIISSTAVIGGYYGIGPAAVISSVDEGVLLSAPIGPHQLFMARYIRRVVRKVSFVFLGVLSILPLLWSADVFFFAAVLLMISLVVFLEANYLLGCLSSHVRLTVTRRTSSRLHHLLPVLLAGLVLVPTLPVFSAGFNGTVLVPFVSMGLIVSEITDLSPIGLNPVVSFGFLGVGFLILFFMVANTSGYQHYELFSAVKGREETEGRFSKIVRGEVDFSSSTWRDPVSWIVLKDFWTRLRSPMQVWKYVYAVGGTILVVYLNIVRPPWFQPLMVPPALAFAIVPAFLLMLILLIQMSSVTSLLRFVDEKENVYLLKASPFRSWDIVSAKYILSLVEVSLAAAPLCGFLVYILRIEGFFSLITLAAPLVILFTATGVTIGAYVPVLTSSPRTLPVPLAFSYPIINLSIGAVLVFLVAYLADVLIVLVALPLFTIALTFFFLGLSVLALNSYK